MLPFNSSDIATAHKHNNITQQSHTLFVQGWEGEEFGEPERKGEDSIGVCALFSMCVCRHFHGQQMRIHDFDIARYPTNWRSRGKHWGCGSSVGVMARRREQRLEAWGSPRPPPGIRGIDVLGNRATFLDSARSTQYDPLVFPSRNDDNRFDQLTLK